ncbi:MAG: DUF354 domain-containing protein [Bacteroidetes bacterium]|nr:DUF354 domain-containing protein [Bacteroidota bacterium]
MRIFVDLGHPAHVHYIKNFYAIMLEKGHEFFITARDKDCNHALLRHYRIPFYSRGKGGRNLLTKGLYLLKTDIKLYRLAKKFKPDVFLSFCSPYAAHAAALCGRKSVVLDDTEKNKFIQLLYRPFTQKILTPDCYMQTLGEKQIKFPSYLEMLYLHPKRFTPDPGVLKELEVDEKDKFFILRFVSLHASHDIGNKGITLENKIDIVNRLQEYGKVFISAENSIPYELSKFAFPLAPDRLHHALYYAHMLFGESATMASEAAVLGTPAIYVNTDGRGYTFEEENRYSLVSNFSDNLKDQGRAMERAIQIASDNLYKINLQPNNERLIHDKVDLTEWLISYIEKEFELNNNV